MFPPNESVGILHSDKRFDFLLVFNKNTGFHPSTRPLPLSPAPLSPSLAYRSLILHVSTVFRPATCLVKLVPDYVYTRELA